MSYPSAIRMRPEQFERITRAATDAEPAEACGLIVGSLVRDPALGEPPFVLVEEFTIEDNAAAHPEHSYEVSREALLAVLRAVEPFGVLGAWHSHPGGPAGLSGPDIESSPSLSDYVHLILSPYGLTAWVVAHGGAEPEEIPVRVHGRAG